MSLSSHRLSNVVRQISALPIKRPRPARRALQRHYTPAFYAMGCEWSELADSINRAILGPRIEGAPIDFGSCTEPREGHLPLGIDTSKSDRLSRSHDQQDGATGRFLLIFHLVWSFEWLKIFLKPFFGFFVVR